jgi:hypothetical protein
MMMMSIEPARAQSEARPDDPDPAPTNSVFAGSGRNDGGKSVRP